MELNGKRIPFLGEAKHKTREALGMTKTKFATGGRVHQYPKMKAGAGSGEGRIEKAKAYGKNAKP